MKELISRLQQERDELLADAERYRWLREKNSITDPGYWGVLDSHEDWAGKDLDAAIDAAMKGTT